MAYSVFVNPKIHVNSNYYPEESDNSIADYERMHPASSSYHNEGGRNLIKSKLSLDKKCPIYVHHFNDIRNNAFSENDNLNEYNRSTKKGLISPSLKVEVTNSLKRKKLKKSAIEKLEETYWNSWKPNKYNKIFKQLFYDNLHEVVNISPSKKSESKKAKKKKKFKEHGDNNEDVIEEPKNNVLFHYTSNDFDKWSSSKSLDSEVRYMIGLNPELTPSEVPDEYVETIISKFAKATDDTPEVPQVLEKEPEENQIDNTPEKTETTPEKIEDGFDYATEPVITEEPSKEIKDIRIVEKGQAAESNSSTQLTSDENFLKHTDSFILHIKKRAGSNLKFQQPKCIRLYKNSSSNSNYVRGGSYPLKSCLKKDKDVKIDSGRLGKSGTSAVSSDSYYKSFKSKLK